MTVEEKIAIEERIGVSTPYMNREDINRIDPDEYEKYLILLKDNWEVLCEQECDDDI